MSIGLTGGCQCGAVRDAVAGPVREAYWCHCRMCQRAVGNVAAAFINVAKADVVIEGPVAYHASSPIARRGFCAACGTPLSFDYPDSDRMDLTLGSLDEPDRFAPTSHFGVEAHVPGWIALGDRPALRADDHQPLRDRWARAGCTPP